MTNRDPRSDPPTLTVAGGMACVGLLLIVGARASGATLYVNNASPACLDTGPGTPDAPFRTISGALAAQQVPGTTIIVMPGVYHEQVEIGASGAPDNPIRIQAQGAPGSPVVVDGADDLSGAGPWTPFAGNVWVAPAVTWSPKQVFADGARLTPSAEQPGDVPVNGFRRVAGQGLYVNLGGDNPGLHQILVGHRLFAIHATGASWVVIDGFATAHAEWAGVEVEEESSQITVSNVAATFENNYGIQVDDCTAVRISSCVASDNLWSGIALTGGSTGCTIQGCESFRNLTPEHSSGIHDYGSPGNRIEGNRVHDNAYNGIFMSKGATNNVLIQNQSWNNAHQGIEDLFCTGNYHVGDVSYGNGWNGFAIEGGATQTTLYNCIAVNNNTAHISDTANLEVDADSAPGLTSDDNLFWDASGRPVIRYSSAYYPNVSDFVAASGQDTRTIQADPLFANPAAGDFRLTAGSPAIDNANSGVPNWPLTDAGGRPRRDDLHTANGGLGPLPFADRGALEYQPGVPEPLRHERRIPIDPVPDDDLDVGQGGGPASALGPSSALAAGAAPPGGRASGVTPNPMRGSATLAFTLSRPGPVRIRLFDIQSRVVRSLRNLQMGSAGRNVVNLDARDDDGVALRPGVYLYEIRAGAEQVSGRLVVVK